MVCKLYVNELENFSKNWWLFPIICLLCHIYKSFLTSVPEEGFLSQGLWDILSFLLTVSSLPAH